MRNDWAIDDSALRRLPLPLAQLARRALNAQSSRDRFYNAYFLWEAALKLTASTAVVEYVESGEHDPQIAERLQHLARPALGHWWEFVRRLAPVLAERGVPGFAELTAVLLGRVRDDLPRLAGLNAVIEQTLGGPGGARSVVRVSELFDRLIQLRNEELGHGATGQRPAEVYDRLAPALLAGMMELFGAVDVLAGRQLLHVADVRRLSGGQWLIERYLLIGESPRRLESVEFESDSASLPLPERVYLVPGAPEEPRSMLDSGPRNSLGPGGGPTVSLHPLLLFESDQLSGKAFFLNSTRRSQQAQYLCYTTGEVVNRESLGQEHRELLSRVLGQVVRKETVEEWEAKSQAEEPAFPVPSPPRTLGEFELLSRIGRGGMAVVYRAWQPSLGRQVALKSLMHVGDPKAQARFSREIRALGRVEHPHLVKVYASGSDGERWFYAMELLEGADLAAVCERLGTSGNEVGETEWRAAVSTAWENRQASEESLSRDSDGIAQLERERRRARAAPIESLPQARAGASHVNLVVQLIQQVAEAVGALHEAGIVHRDIKPGNIMLSRDGAHAVLMDLGLAQLADDTAGRLTRTRQFVGTLRYASPEQVLAAGNLDHRSDIYSLGATLWELLTLRPLFGGSDETPTPDLMLAIQSVDPDDPRRYNPHVPRDLAAIVLRCLEKRRDQRYPTAQALIDDLERFLRGEPVTARPVRQAERAWRWCRRNPVVSSLIATVLLALVGGGIGMTYFGLRAMRALESERAANQRKVLADVDALLDAVPAAVPGILNNLESGGEPVHNRLLELHRDDTLPLNQRRRIEMALLPSDSSVRASLIDGLLAAEPAECILLRDVLADDGSELAPKLWELVRDPGTPVERRFRVAVALALFDAENEQWSEIGEETAVELVSANPLHLGVWKDALRPVAGQLTPSLERQFRLSEPEQFQRREMTAFVLADYARDAPDVLADLTADADERQFAVVFPALARHGESARIALRLELSRTGAPGSSAQETEALAQRRANAAAALVRLGESDVLWPLLVHGPDPRLASLLVHRLAPLGADPQVLIARVVDDTESATDDGEPGDDAPGGHRSFQETVLFDPESSIRRAAILALGEFDERALPPSERERLASRLLELYEDDADAGVHSAARWLLEAWGRGELVARTSARLAAHAGPGDTFDTRRNWFVDADAGEFVVVQGPVEFVMGSPPAEEGRQNSGRDERQHRVRIEHSFAVAAREVTVEQFRRFRSDHDYNSRYAPSVDCPVNLVPWYAAAHYCNWLSEQAGLPPDQWCYLPNEENEYAAGMRHAPDNVSRTGYRMPTEAEWEFSCRAGTVTSRFHGESDELLNRYAWYIEDPKQRSTIPVGRLKPNALGLFDMLGNAWERCQGRFVDYGAEDGADRIDVVLDDNLTHAMRGGSIFDVPTVRSADREMDGPSGGHNYVGFRLVRTVLRPKE